MQAALSQIHQRGVVHNAIHKENIMVDHATGLPRFVDFAVAQLTTSEEAFENEDHELNIMVAQTASHPFVLQYFIDSNLYKVFLSVWRF